MKARVFITAVCAMFAMTINAQTLHEMAAAAPSNATEMIMGTDTTRAVPGFFPRQAPFKIAIKAEADSMTGEFDYEDYLFDSPEMAKGYLTNQAMRHGQKVGTVNGKEGFTYKRRGEDVHTTILTAPNRVLETEVDRGSIQYGKSNLYTPYADLMKNAFFFAIGQEKKGLKTVTHVFWIEPAGKEALATASIEYSSKAVAERCFNAGLKPERGDAAENAIRAKIKRVTIPGLDAANRITFQVPLTSAREIEALMDVAEDMADEDDDDDDDDDDD